MIQAQRGEKLSLVFSDEADLSRFVSEKLRLAKYSIKTAQLNLTSDTMADELKEAAANGVEVEAVVNTVSANVFEKLSACGVNIYLDRKASTLSLMHHKFTLLDGRKVLFGSLNFSDTSLFYSYDYLIESSDCEVLKCFEKEWGRIRGERVSDPYTLLRGGPRSTVKFTPAGRFRGLKRQALYVVLIGSIILNMYLGFSFFPR